MKRTIQKFTLLRLPRLWTFWKSRTSSLKTPILMTSSSLLLQLIKARALPEMTKLLTVALNKNKGPYVFKSHASLILKLLIFPMQKDFILLLPRTLMTSSSKWKKNKLMKFNNEISKISERNCRRQLSEAFFRRKKKAERSETYHFWKWKNSHAKSSIFRLLADKNELRPKKNGLFYKSTHLTNMALKVDFEKFCHGAFSKIWTWISREIQIFEKKWKIFGKKSIFQKVPKPPKRPVLTLLWHFRKKWKN